MTWNLKGLIFAAIAIVSNSLFPDSSKPKIFIDIISSLLENCIPSPESPIESYNSKFQEIIEEALNTSPFEVGDAINTITDKLSQIYFQFDSSLSKEEICDKIKAVLANNNVYVNNISDETINQFANIIRLNMTNAVLSNINLMAVDTHHKLEALSQNISRHIAEDHKFSSTALYGDKWLTEMYIEPTDLYVSWGQETDALNKVRKHRKVIITGTLRGVGKTELARKLCQICLDSYNYIGWIDYTGNLEQDLARSLHPSFIVNGSPLNRLNEFVASHSDEVILFIDNVVSVGDESEDRSLAILRKLPCAIVVTTRLSSFYEYEPYNLDILEESNAITLFYKYYSNKTASSSCTDTDTVKEIVSMVGYHPLTIELIARNAKKQHLTIPKLLHEIKNRGLDLHGAMKSNWNGLKNESIAKQLKKLYAWTSISDIPEYVYILKCFSILPALFISTEKIKSLDIVNNNRESCLEKLCDLGWIINRNNFYYMHDVVRSAIKYSTNLCMEDCQMFIEDLCVQATTEVDYQKALQYIPIFLSIANSFNKEKSLPTLGKVYNNLHFLYNQASDYINGEYWILKAINFFEQQPSNRKAIMVGLAYVYKNYATLLCQKNYLAMCLSPGSTTPDFGQCIHYFKKSLCYFKKTSHKSDPITYKWKTYVVFNDLARAYRLQGNINEAYRHIYFVVEKKLNLLCSLLSETTLLYRSLSNCILITNPRYHDWKTFEEIFNSFVQDFFKHFSFEDVFDAKKTLKSFSVFELQKSIIDNEKQIKNELLPSFAKSCDLAADINLALAEKYSSIAAFRTYYSEEALVWSNRAMFLCSVIFKDFVSPTEGAIYTTASIVALYSGDLRSANNLQDYAIDRLEAVYHQKADTQTCEELWRAYNNMYVITRNREWQDKANEIANRFRPRQQ